MEDFKQELLKYKNVVKGAQELANYLHKYRNEEWKRNNEDSQLQFTRNKKYKYEFANFEVLQDLLMI